MATSPIRCCTAALLCCVLSRTVPAAAQATSSYEQLQTFSSILNQIRLNYVDSVSYSELVHAAIDGVLESLDPHSRFVSRADAEKELAYSNGQLAGTGIVLEDVDAVATVQTVMSASPGARAGVLAGDRLLAINDSSIAGVRASTLQYRLLGAKGNKLRLLFERGQRLAPETFRTTVKCDYLIPKSIGISRLLGPSTGYIRLVGFQPDGGDEVESALRRLKSDGAKRVILDLRGNPGGLVVSAVEIASLFFPKGTTVFRTEGRTRNAGQVFTTGKEGPFRELPLIVLIDRGSASASEALAGSLQDQDRALLIGRRSFGKALVQQLLPVPPQGDGVWLTVAHVVTPSGRVIQRAYHGLKAEQYYSFAGKSGAEQDTLQTFRTSKGRQVRGGGGIVPDVVLPDPAALPRWFFAASDSGYDTAVADSVAATLPKDPAARLKWFDAVEGWQGSLVTPFLARIHDRLQVPVTSDSALTARLGRVLAWRTTEVRWGPEAADEFTLHNDPDIQIATTYLGRIDEILGASR